ncbi:MAG: hypothetical protein ACRD19_06775 [Terriglobia bacterium]
MPQTPPKPPAPAPVVLAVSIRMGLKAVLAAVAPIMSVRREILWNVASDGLRWRAAGRARKDSPIPSIEKIVTSESDEIRLPDLIAL